MTERIQATQPCRPGEYLRAARLDQDMEVSTLAERTSLSEQTIECLENDDWLALPAMVYIRGYVRLVCRELDVDTKVVLTLLEEESIQFNRPLLVVDEDSSFVADLWAKRRSAVAVGVAVATVLIGLLTQIISIGASPDAAETDSQRPDITVESEQR